MKALADIDGDAYLPNIKPVAPVDYVFICMEPSLGRWAKTVDAARIKVEAGFLNFTSSIEDFILHYCIRTYLCESTQQYHLTDVSKGAMLGDLANKARTERYDRWNQLLLKELDIVARSGAGIFAVGNAVTQHLERREFQRPFTQVIHYSPLAGRARIAGIVGHENDFEKLKITMTLKSVLDTAEMVLAASVPEVFLDETLKRLRMKTQFTESQQMLIFNYKLAFELFKAKQSAAAPCFHIPASKNRNISATSQLVVP